MDLSRPRSYCMTPPDPCMPTKHETAQSNSNRRFASALTGVEMTWLIVTELERVLTENCLCFLASW